MSVNMDKRNIIQELKENYHRLTKSQKIIGRFMIEHYEEVAMMSALELAEQVDVSDATIIRFARSIGFSGFSELKDHIRYGIKKFDTPYQRVARSLEAVSSADDVLMQVGKNDLLNLEKFLIDIDRQKIKQTVDCIFAAKTIYLMGMAASVCVIEFLVMHLRRMGFNVRAITEGGSVNLEKLMPMTENDLMIASTFPRYSKDTYHAIAFAKTKGAKVVMITDEDFSMIGMKSDIVLSTRIENLTYFNSLVVPMELCNLLVMAVLDHDRDRIHLRIKENTENNNLLDTTL